MIKFPDKFFNGEQLGLPAKMSYTRFKIASDGNHKIQLGENIWSPLNNFTIQSVVSSSWKISIEDIFAAINKKIEEIHRATLMAS